MTSSFWAVVLLFCVVLTLCATPPSPPWTRWALFVLTLAGLVMWCLARHTV